jgi:hypothetical protein
VRDGKVQRNLLAQLRRIAAAHLQLQQERHSPVDQLEHLVQGRQMLVRVSQSLACQQRRRRCLHIYRDVAHAPQIAIVEDDRRSASRKPDITFNARAERDRRRESGEAVLRNACPMKSTMR